MRMENLGLYKGLPELVLSNEEQDALFDKNQRNHPSTRPDVYAQFRTPIQQPTEKSTPKKPA